MQCNIIIAESVKNIINELFIILLEEKGFFLIILEIEKKTSFLLTTLTN